MTRIFQVQYIKNIKLLRQSRSPSPTQPQFEFSPKRPLKVRCPHTRAEHSQLRNAAAEKKKPTHHSRMGKCSRYTRTATRPARKKALASLMMTQSRTKRRQSFPIAILNKAIKFRAPDKGRIAALARASPFLAPFQRAPIFSSLASSPMNHFLRSPPPSSSLMYRRRRRQRRAVPRRKRGSQQA